MMGGNFTNYPVMNGSGLIDLFRHSNDVTGGVFWIVILAMAYLICFITVSRIRPVKDAFSVSSWICGIFSMFLFVLGLIGENIMIVFALLMVVSLVVLFLRKDDEM